LRTWLSFLSFFLSLFLFVFSSMLEKIFSWACVFSSSFLIFLAHVSFDGKIYGERFINWMKYLFCGWMDVANFQCRSLAYEGGVYVILITKAWKASSKGHNNLTNLNVITNSICVRLSNVNNIWLW
jgi:hypothetical protein